MRKAAKSNQRSPLSLGHSVKSSETRCISHVHHLLQIRKSGLQMMETALNGDLAERMVKNKFNLNKKSL